MFNLVTSARNPFSNFSHGQSFWASPAMKFPESGLKRHEKEDSSSFSALRYSSSRTLSVPRPNGAGPQASTRACMSSSEMDPILIWLDQNFYLVADCENWNIPRGTIFASEIKMQIWSFEFNNVACPRLMIPLLNFQGIFQLLDMIHGGPETRRMELRWDEIYSDKSRESWVRFLGTEDQEEKLLKKNCWRSADQSMHFPFYRHFGILAIISHLSHLPKCHIFQGHPSSAMDNTYSLSHLWSFWHRLSRIRCLGFHFLFFWLSLLSL